MSKGLVLIAAPVHRVLTDALSSVGYEYVIREKITQQEAFELIKTCSGVITSTRLQLDKALLDAAPLLRWIGRMGSGMEVVDVAYAAKKGIKCYSSPEGNSNAVAEHALGMLLSLTKRITASNNELKQGIWKRDENRGIELEGKTIGIIGFGYTGRAFARKLQAFDMRILTYDKYNLDNVPGYVESCPDLSLIFQESDVISFHVPLQEDTVHYMNENFIYRMHKHFILINTSRGIVVDTKALLKGLQEGKIRGACLDVYEEEPLAKMSRDIRIATEQLMKMEQVILTPHIAGYSYEAIYKMSKTLSNKVINT